MNEGGVIEIETTVLHSRCSLLRFLCIYLPVLGFLKLFPNFLVVIEYKTGISFSFAKPKISVTLSFKPPCVVDSSMLVATIIALAFFVLTDRRTVKMKFDVQRKKYNYKTVNRVCKRVKIYLYTLKKDLFGCLRIEETEAMTTKQV